MTASSDSSVVPPLLPLLPCSASQASSEFGTGGSRPTDGPPIRYGVSAPISLKLPLPKDFQLTEKLEEMMRERNLYETAEGERQREVVLSELSKLLKEWVREVALQRHLPEETARRAGGKIFTFGSFRLGVVTPGGDIDTLCLLPSFVTREAFFEFFKAKLQQDPKVTKLQPVPDAFTPIIKFCHSGIDIDLLFARYSATIVPESLESLADDNLLRNADEKTARSLNGCRVAGDLLNLVPNKEHFITALRFIKYWAKQRGIYSNVMGYLGGISWALLVARICQLYPHFLPSQLINRFFRFYSDWKWSNPILLAPIKEHSNEPGLMGFHVWNPKKNALDRAHLMPIITPSFPSMNSTHNVTVTTREILIKEFHRGRDKVNLVEKRKADWASLVEPFDFFRSSNDFLVFSVLGRGELAYSRWSGWVESKMRFLFKRLEALGLLTARVWPQSVPFKDTNFDHASAIYLALHFDLSLMEGWGPAGENNVVDLKSPVGDFIHQLLIQWPDKEAFNDQINLCVKHIRRRDLPGYIREFRQSQGHLELDATTSTTVAGLPSSLPTVSAASSSVSVNGGFQAASSLTGSDQEDTVVNISSSSAYWAAPQSACPPDTRAEAGPQCPPPWSVQRPSGRSMKSPTSAAQHSPISSPELSPSIAPLTSRAQDALSLAPPAPLSRSKCLVTELPANQITGSLEMRPSGALLDGSVRREDWMSQVTTEEGGAFDRFAINLPAGVHATKAQTVPLNFSRVSGRWGVGSGAPLPLPPTTSEVQGADKGETKGNRSGATQEPASGTVLKDSPASEQRRKRVLNFGTTPVNAHTSVVLPHTPLAAATCADKSSAATAESASAPSGSEQDNAGKKARIFL